MLESGHCPRCGGSYALMGRVHLCRPRVTVTQPEVTVTDTVTAAVTATCEECTRLRLEVAELRRLLSASNKRVAERMRRMRARRREGG